MGKVFISHTAIDKPFVRRLAARIESKGYDVWLDEHQLVAGDPLAERIGEALERAKVVLVVVSRHSIASRWLGYELNIATQRMIEGQCRVIPVVIDGSDLPAAVQGLLYADCRKSLSRGWKSIETALQHESSRSLAEQSFYQQAERLLSSLFSTGFTSSLAEYGSSDFSIIGLDVKDEKGDYINIPYEIVEVNSTRAKPLAVPWWDDYSRAIERIPYAYSLIISNRPVQLLFDLVHPDTRRIGFRSAGSHGYKFGEHQVLFVDLSGVLDEIERKRLLTLAVSFLNAEAQKRVAREPNTSLEASSRKGSLTIMRDRRKARG